MLCSNNDPWHYSVENARVLGLCTGALSAAAVSCSRSLSELVSSAIDAIVVAFRTGICVTDVAQRVEPSNNSDQSWSIIVGGLASANAVDKFCDETVRTPSVIHSTSTTTYCTVTNPAHLLDLALD